MLPAIVVRHSEVDLNKWPPLRPLWLSDQMHARRGGRAIGLAGIALNAGTHNVFPGRRTSSISRKHMIQIQVFAFENLPAVLARILIALEDVVTGEFHLLLWHAIKKHQHNDPWDANSEGNRMNA